MPPKKKVPKSHARAEGETQITVSLPKWLKDAITDLACQDRRSRSKWVVLELEKIIERKKAEKIVPVQLLRAAESEGQYSAKKGKK
jgi:hypothetical protein